MKFDLNYEAGISNQGNVKNLRMVMNRARRGEDITIGFLGGSITQGCLSSTPELCYAYLVYQWWVQTFQKAKINYVNAGIGATDSQFGCARVEDDLLSYHPDFTIIEYSVNDENTDHYLETYEGVVRRVLKAEKPSALMLVHNVYYDSGRNAEKIHGKVAKHYDLPSVSMKNTIYPKVLSGEIKNRDITPDDLHPNDLGHEMVASVIIFRLEQILEGLTKEDNWNDEKIESEIPAPLTANEFEASVLWNNTKISPVMKGFLNDSTPKNGITDIFKNGWIATNKGDSIEFLLEGSCIGVQYRRTIQLPAPVARLVIDHEEKNAVILDGNFDETWGDKLVLDTVLEHGEKKMHHVKIEVIETHQDDQLPFYLVSLISS